MGFIFFFTPFLFFFVSASDTAEAATVNLIILGGFALVFFASLKRVRAVRVATSGQVRIIIFREEGKGLFFISAVIAVAISIVRHISHLALIRPFCRYHCGLF